MSGPASGAALLITLTARWRWPPASNTCLFNWLINNYHEKLKLYNQSKETKRRGPGDGSSSRLLNRISAQIATVIAPAIIILALVSFGFLVFYPVSLQPAAKDRKIVEKLIPITEDKSFKFGEDENYLFNTPVRLEITDENIFVLDSLDHRLQVYDLNGKYIKSIGAQGQGAS